MVGLEAEACERKRKEREEEKGRKQKGVERSGRRDGVKGAKVRVGKMGRSYQREERQEVEQSRSG